MMEQDVKKNFGTGNILLTTEQAAAVLGLSPDTLKWWRVRNRERGPRYFKLHQHAVRYSRNDLEVWLHKRHVDVSKNDC